MEKKKPTNAQLERLIKNAIVLVPKNKTTKSVFFSDKGLRVTVSDEYAVIATGFHRHVFDAFTSSGVSRPHLYAQRLVEIALENDCKTENGYSLYKLVEVLKAKEDKAEYHIVTYIDWWLMTIFSPLYNIGESEMSSWLVYFKYLQAIAVNSIVLEEHNEDLTNKGFTEKFMAIIKELTEGVDEHVILKAKTDEEIMRENLEAMQEEEVEQNMQEEES